MAAIPQIPDMSQETTLWWMIAAIMLADRLTQERGGIPVEIRIPILYAHGPTTELDVVADRVEITQDLATRTLKVEPRPKANP